jgi:hypothetical protein
MTTDLATIDLLNETRRELARAYNAHFAGARVMDKVIELENRLLSMLARGTGRKAS